MIDQIAGRNISLKPRVSVQKWLLVLLPHFVSFILILSLIHVQMPAFVLIFLLLLIVFSCFYYLRLHIWLSAKNSVKLIFQDTKNQWFLVNSAGEEKSVCLLPDSFYSNYLLILNFVDIYENKYSVIITPDSVPRDSYRQLKVSLITEKIVAD